MHTGITPTQLIFDNRTLIDIEQDLIHICQRLSGIHQINADSHLLQPGDSFSTEAKLLEAIHRHYPWAQISRRDLKENESVAKLAQLFAQKAQQKKDGDSIPDVNEAILGAPEHRKQENVEQYLWDRIAHARAMHPRDVRQIVILQGRLSLDLVQEDLLWDLHRDFQLNLQAGELLQNSTMDDFSKYITNKLSESSKLQHRRGNVESR